MIVRRLPEARKTGFPELGNTLCPLSERPVKSGHCVEPG